MGFARNAEVWIFGALIVLGAAACLSGPAERAAPAPMARTLPAAVGNAVAEGELAQPEIHPMQPMYVVYVVGKRPDAAQKRAARKSNAG